MRRFELSGFKVAMVILVSVLWGCGDSGERAAVEVLHAIDQGKVTGTRGTLAKLGHALQAYSIDNSGYPEAISMREALTKLVPAYLPFAAAQDAWGNDIAYQSDGASFTLRSPGADRKMGTSDDMVMIDGRITQMPSREGS